MRVLVCGGRHFNQAGRLNHELDRLQMTGVTAIIHGGTSGADHLAGLWAHSEGLVPEIYEADWHKHGLAAGPIRNQRMIDEGKPDLVIAFPGGRGTADMIRRAKAAGIEVREVSALSPPVSADDGER